MERRFATIVVFALRRFHTVSPEILGESLDLIGMIGLAVTVATSFGMFAFWLGKKLTEMAMALEHWVQSNADSHDDIRRDVLVGFRETKEDIGQVGSKLAGCEVKLTDTQVKLEGVKSKVDTLHEMKGDTDG